MKLTAEQTSKTLSELIEASIQPGDDPVINEARILNKRLNPNEPMEFLISVWDSASIYFESICWEADSDSLEVSWEFRFKCKDFSDISILSWDNSNDTDFILELI